MATVWFDRNRRGGGAAIYVENNLDYIHRSEFHSDLVKILEIILKTVDLYCYRLYLSTTQ